MALMTAAETVSEGSPAACIMLKKASAVKSTATTPPQSAVSPVSECGFFR